MKVSKTYIIEVRFNVWCKSGFKLIFLAACYGDDLHCIVRSVAAIKKDLRLTGKGHKTPA